jgi:hypothetical protein
MLIEAACITNQGQTTQVVADGLFSHHKWVFVQTLVCRDF